MKKDLKIPILISLLLFYGIVAIAQKPVLQQSNPSQVDTYLKNRRALVGDGCTVNKLITAVGVGSWVTNLDNLVDEDLDNYAAFPKIVDVTVGVNPITSVRDMKHHYAAGTTAGYVLSASSGSSLLSLDIIKAFAISFYLEGELIETVAVNSGQDAGVLGLSLLQLPGTAGTNIELSVTAPCEFDEIALLPSGGVDLSAVTDCIIKYAFAGNPKTYTLTSHTPNGIVDYAADHDRGTITLDTETNITNDLIDSNLDDGVTSALLGSYATVYAFPSDRTQKGQTFKKGTIIGFRYRTTSVLSLDLLAGLGSSTIELYSVNGNSHLSKTEVQSTTIPGSVLGLKLLNSNTSEITIVAEKDFSVARISMPTINVGGTTLFYAFVQDPVDVTHKCDIEATAHSNICESENTFQLSAKVPVTWSVMTAPIGSSATVNANGEATGLTVNGSYTFRATSSDCNFSPKCYQDVTVIRGIEGNVGICDNPLLNGVGEERYELSTESHDNGLVIVALNNLQDAENILNTSFDDYATYTGGVQLATVKHVLVGVKTKDGSLISDGSAKKRVGFVVEMKSMGLGLDAIQLFSIKTYRNGTQTSSSPITESNLVSLNLIGSSKMQKMRFCVTVDEGVQFDEFVLCNNEVLAIDISRINIYYPFVEDADDNTLGACADPLGCDGYIVSNEMGATINGSETQNAGTVNVATVINNLSHLIDNDLSTYLLIENTVSVGSGMVVAVKLGRTFTPGQQIGLVIDDITHLANVNVGAWLTMKTYKNGVETGDSKSDWSVLGADVVGYGDKSILYIQPTTDYDEIRITVAGLAQAADAKRLYGLTIRNDADQDGVPDCRDENSCPVELVLDEEKLELNKRYDEYNNANLVLHRTFTNDKWNSFVLPVDLTWGQFRRAFGNEAMLAEPIGLNAQTPTLIEFQFIEPDTDDAIAVNHGQFYIIHPQSAPDVEQGEVYVPIDTDWDGPSVNGPIYFIKGVNYTKSVNEQPVSDMDFSHDANGPDHNDIRFKGTYVHLDGSTNDKIPANSYAFSGGDIYHLSSPHALKGFRFWIEDFRPNGSNLSFCFSDTPSGIRVVELADMLGNGKVYNLCGQEMSVGNGMNSLPGGIYVVSGKKVVIK